MERQRSLLQAAAEVKMRGSRQYVGGAESRTRRNRNSWHKWQGPAAAKRLNSQYFGRPVRADEVAVEKAMAEEWLNAEGKTRFTSRKWHVA